MIILYKDGKIREAESLVSGSQPKQVATISKGDVGSDVELNGNLVVRFRAENRARKSYSTLSDTYRAIRGRFRRFATLR